jgi:hypothetical protein
MKPVPTETERLRARIDRFVARLGDEFPKEKLARALLAKGCDVSLADAGLTATVWMANHAANLLAGHWSAGSVETFIERKM